MDKRRIRSIRIRSGLTQQQFSAEYKIPLSTIRNWEQGTRQPDQSAILYLLCIEALPKSVRVIVNSPQHTMF